MRLKLRDGRIAELLGTDRLTLTRPGVYGGEDEVLEFDVAELGSVELLERFHLGFTDAVHPVRGPLRGIVAEDAETGVKVLLALDLDDVHAFADGLTERRLQVVRDLPPDLPPAV